MKCLLVIALFFGIWANLVLADNSYRSCMILPIADNLDGALAFQVYERVEQYLKTSNWCEYTSNSEVMNILANFRQNLREHLANPGVLTAIGEKVKAGSLIRVVLDNDVSAVEIKIVIFASNGQDVLFKETTRLNSNAVELIGQTIINWLEVYEKSIPYQGRVLGALGDQVTIDFGKNRHLGPQSQLRIERPLAKKQHPLLQEIVDWQTELIALAQVFHVSENQAQARIIRYEKDRLVEKGDWINPVKFSPTVEPVQEEKYPAESGISRGNLGQLGVYLTFDSSSVSLQYAGAAKNELSGGLWGIDANLEMWISRHYWAEIEVNARIGTLSAQSRSLIQQENFSMNRNIILRSGYRYLPLGFFYGPRMDFYGGYAHYHFGLEDSASDQVSASDLRGLIAGLKGDLPLHSLVRALVRAEFILFPSFQEDQDYHPTNGESSSLRFEVGAVFNYSPSMQIVGGIVTDSVKIKYPSIKKYLNFTDSILRLGVMFSY